MLKSHNIQTRQFQIRTLLDLHNVSAVDFIGLNYQHYLPFRCSGAKCIIIPMFPLGHLFVYDASAAAIRLNVT